MNETEIQEIKNGKEKWITDQNRRGRLKREVIYVYLWLYNQYNIVIFFQLKNKVKKEKNWLNGNRPERKSERGNSLAVQWLGVGTFTAGAQVQSVVGELWS